MKKLLLAVCSWIYSLLIKLDELYFLLLLIDSTTHLPGQALLWLENYAGFTLSAGQEEGLSLAYKLVKFGLFALLYAPSILFQAKLGYLWICKKIKDLMDRL